MIDVSRGFEQIDEVNKNVIYIKKIIKSISFGFYRTKLQMWKDL